MTQQQLHMVDNLLVRLRTFEQRSIAVTLQPEELWLLLRYIEHSQNGGV